MKIKSITCKDCGGAAMLCCYGDDENILLDKNLVVVFSHDRRIKPGATLQEVFDRYPELETNECGCDTCNDFVEVTIELEDGSTPDLDELWDMLFDEMMSHENDEDDECPCQRCHK